MKHTARIISSISIVMTFFLIAALTTSCGKNNIPQGHETIIAKVGDKTISKNEFIRRAEYTIRPKYCNQNYYIHKKIVLNSLIAEKLFALEAGEDNELFANEQFQAYIKGRQEQTMRQLLYHQEAVSKVELDTTEIKRTYRVAGREYHLSYFSMSDSAVAANVADSLKADSLFFETLHSRINGLNEIPSRKVKWSDPEDERVHDALFSDVLKKNQVVGPLKIDKGEYLVMRVDGWINRPVITDTEITKRLDDVKEKLTTKHAGVIWSNYVAEVMKGKRVEFMEDSFWALNKLFYDIYYKTDKEMKDAFNQKYWKGKDVELTIENIEDIDEIYYHPFFKVNDEIWTVRDFHKALASHPLVFRKQKMKSSEFPEQFKLAVVDLIRDQYLNKEAYKKKLDQSNITHRNVEMWKDALTALFQRKNVLYLAAQRGESLNGNYIQVISKALNPYVDSLQTKYNDQIEINVDEFDKIQMTRIDMFVKQTNVPYPVIVPSFPLLTTEHRMDYGSVMKTD